MRSCALGALAAALAYGWAALTDYMSVSDKQRSWVDMPSVRVTDGAASTHADRTLVS